MDRTVRIRTAAWFATGIVLAVACTVLVTQAWSANAAPGDSDSTFVPTAGCRIVDTRPAPNTVGLRSAPLSAGDIFEVTVHGQNGDCTGPLAIPADAVGVALNVTAVNATSTSNIRVYPANLTEVPTLSNLNVTAGAPPTPNKVDVQLSPDGKIRVFNFRGTVNIFIDVVGYYTNSTLTELAAGLATANAKIAALETATATNASGIAALDAAQPFAEVATAESLNFLTATPVSYLDVQVTAPVDGHVTINYSTVVDNITAGAESRCNVYRQTEIPAINISFFEPGVGFWESAVVGVGNEGSVSGTNRFDISADQTVIFSLACEEGGGEGVVRGRAMTATFTPAP